MLGRKEKLVSFRNGLFRSGRKEVGLVIYCCVTNTTPKVNGVCLALKSMVWLGLGGTAHLCLALSQGPTCMCPVVDGGCCYIFHWAGTGNLHAASPHGLDGITACWLHSRENALRERPPEAPLPIMIWSWKSCSLAFATFCLSRSHNSQSSYKEKGDRHHLLLDTTRFWRGQSARNIAVASFEKSSLPQRMFSLI